MVAAAGDLLALFFLASLRCSAAAILSASSDIAPLWIGARHPPLSSAVRSKIVCLMLKAFKEALSVYLKRFL